jgi:hypothetical protein
MNRGRSSELLMFFDGRKQDFLYTWLHQVPTLINRLKSPRINFLLVLDTIFILQYLHISLSVNRICNIHLGIVRVATMTTNGMPSAFPSVTHPTSSPSTSNRNQPTYDPAAWEEPPPFLLQVPDKNARIDIRNANHNVYRTIGTNTMWHKYLQLGYYVFDDCMDFNRASKSTGKMHSPTATRLFGISIFTA